MKTKNLSFDEIVFEKRNKDYGAFRLRKIYSKVVARAFFFGTTFFLMILAVPLVASYMNRVVKIKIDDGPTAFENLAKPKPEKLPELPKLAKLPELEKIIAISKLIVVDNDSLDDFRGLMDFIDNGGNTGVDPKKEEGIIEDKGDVGIIKIEDEKPFIVVELMPTFSGGVEEMYRYLSENIKYPIPAKEAGIAGKVIVTFVVEKDGSITGVQTVKDIGGGCGAEAERVVSAMPKWNVGKQNGVPVRVQFMLPIQFTLQ
jgi:periplasmic protein TonB